MKKTTLALVLALTAAACTSGSTPATTTTTIAPVTTTLPPAPTTTTEATTTTTMPASPVLATEGDENETVAAIQFLLGCSGYADIEVDGDFGPGTTFAVEAAQDALGFEVTGQPTEDLFALLSTVCNIPRPVEIGEEAVRVVGNASFGTPDEFRVALLFGSTLEVTMIDGLGVALLVLDPDGNPLESADGVSYPITTDGDYTIQVSTEADPAMFTLQLALTTPEGAGSWIITTDGIAYGDTKFTLGEGAEPIIEKIYEFLGHQPRGAYDEFDTGWDDPGQPGFRGIFIEGLAFLFVGPNADNPDRVKHFARVRYVGPSFDAEGNPRPAGWVQTLSGITVGNTLAELKDTYGSSVQPGNSSYGYYYRYGAASGQEVCFYFGDSSPSDSDRITEISTECR